MQTDWLKSSLSFELQNENHPKEHLNRRLNNVQEKVDATAVQTVGEALATLHDGDEFLTAELTTKTIYTAQ